MAKTTPAGERLFSIFPYRGPEMAVHTLRTEGALFMAIHIPWDMIAPHEEQAVKNTRFTLSQLNGRGGIHAAGAVAILEDRAETDMPPTEANMRLVQLWMEYERDKAKVKKVRLVAEGKLSGGLKVPVGTICTVEARRDEKDFYSNGRACLDVVKDGVIAFTVYEDEVEYL